MMIELMEVSDNKISKLRNKLRTPKFPTVVRCRLRFLNVCFSGVSPLYTDYDMVNFLNN